MILSYASEIGSLIYQGNWSVFATPAPLEPVEDCFLDLRILAAAATIADVREAFRGRLEEPDRPKGLYCVHEPPAHEFGYRIEFLWRDGNADSVDVKLAQPKHRK